MFLVHHDLHLLTLGEQAVALVGGYVADHARVAIVGDLDEFCSDANGPSHRTRGQMIDAEV